MFKLIKTIENISNFKILSNRFKTFDCKHQVKKFSETNLNFNENNFEIKLNKSNIKKYPYIWLRDCCTCKSCFDTQNHQHLVDLASVPDDVKPITVSHLKEKIEVICKL